MASIFKHYKWDKMVFDCKLYCQHSVICERAKPDRKRGAALQPLGVPRYQWEIVGTDYVSELPKSGSYGYTTFFIVVCHLTKRRQLSERKKERNSLQKLLKGIGSSMGNWVCSPMKEGWVLSL